jgi:hypothetical protein
MEGVTGILLAARLLPVVVIGDVRAALPGNRCGKKR